MTTITGGEAIAAFSRGAVLKDCHGSKYRLASGVIEILGIDDEWRESIMKMSVLAEREWIVAEPASERVEADPVDVMLDRIDDEAAAEDARKIRDVATIRSQAAEIATLRAALEDKRVDRWHATYNAGISACRDVETIGAVSDACDYAVECANRLHGPLPEVPHE